MHLPSRHHSRIKTNQQLDLLRDDPADLADRFEAADPKACIRCKRPSPGWVFIGRDQAGASIAFCDACYRQVTDEREPANMGLHKSLARRREPD